MARRVIDANLAVASVVPLGYSDQARQLLHKWLEVGDELFAPTLWEYEVVTSLRKSIVGKAIRPERVVPALVEVFQLGVYIVPQTLDAHIRALEWAQRIGQIVAYDAQYLALAEDLEAEFWTADKRLAETAQQAGATWAHWVGEMIE